MKHLLRIAMRTTLFTTFMTAAAFAQEKDKGPSSESTKPFQLALWSSMQSSDNATSIQGARLNLPYGKNRSVHGLDIGIANHVTRDQYGVVFGFGSYAGRDVRGVQSNLVLSMARGEVIGLQESVYNSAGTLYGVQVGVVNQVYRQSHGARFAAVNLSSTRTEGFELGVVNHARRVNGLQFGIVNYASELRGVQIGLINVAMNASLPVLPLFNAVL